MLLKRKKRTQNHRLRAHFFLCEMLLEMNPRSEWKL